MAGTSCSICLDELKDPVSIPCGHIHCEKCLIEYIDAGDDAIRALCPTCRSPFSLAVPDLRTVPNKYHAYIDKSIRRVYIPQDATYAATVRNLKVDVAKYKKQADGLARDKVRLMDRCESQIARANAIAMKEQDIRADNERLKKQLAEVSAKYELLKNKYKAVKHTQPAPSSVTSISAPPAAEVTHPPIVTGSTKRKSSQVFVAIRKRPRLHNKPDPDTHQEEAHIQPEEETRAVPVPAAGPSNLRRRSAGPPPDTLRPRVALPRFENIPYLPGYSFVPPSLAPSMIPFSWDLATGLRMPAPAPRAGSSHPAAGSWSAPAPRASGSRPTAGSERAPTPKVVAEAPLVEWTDEEMDSEDDEDIDEEDDIIKKEPVRGKGKARAQIREPLRQYVFRGRRFEF